MTRILGISGSLRAGSFNTALLKAAQSLAPEAVEFEVATLHGIPLYDGDLEQREGIPTAVQALKERVAASQGVILATPEYNNSVPGVLKNALDWLSRPPDDIPRIFGQRAWAVMGASPSGFGTILAQHAWLGILRHVGARFWPGSKIMVSKAMHAFDSDGQLTDQAVRKQLQGYVADFAAFAAANR
jgi:chromate reductase, NAD(P)H dehydrogenase (quinone)